MDILNEKKWSTERANNYFKQFPWLSGCNFIPSNAINQLEMWQKETYDISTIKKELGMAKELGFNCMRIYLHDLLWEVKEDFIPRFNEVLDTCKSLGIYFIPVLLDDCWKDNPKLGPQPEPKPRSHNSGWLKSPGTEIALDPKKWGRIEVYVKEVLKEFTNHTQIVFWDLYNEPGVPPHHEKMIPFLQAVFTWAREVDPSQPLSTGVWNKHIPEVKPAQLALSDIISFHCYADLEELKEIIEEFKELDRPMICTEYMSRHTGNTFQTHLPVFQENNVGAINWGLVSGKTQTIYPWDFLEKTVVMCEDKDEPTLWFHDILRPDGTPFSQEEVEVIKKINKRREIVSV